MLFEAFLFPEVNEVNTYMIGCEDTREAFLIDAGGISPGYETFLQNNRLRLTGIFLTHFHWDHDQELPKLLKQYDVPVYSMTGKTPNGHAVGEGDSVLLGKLNNRIVQTPGHTPDGITLIVQDRIAFVGDAIFAGSIGGTSSEQNKLEEMDHIRRKIFTLPEDCLLCSGHGPITTVGIENTHNPIFVIR